jgi:hypothetical protein
MIRQFFPNSIELWFKVISLLLYHSFFSMVDVAYFELNPGLRFLLLLSNQASLQWDLIIHQLWCQFECKEFFCH